MEENFSDQQKSLLKRYVTNTDKNVFVLNNLPEVIKGALFSRYSRSTKGLRALLLSEFIEDTTSGFSHEATASEDALLAIQKAQNFYDRILDGYGDDSIAELGGAHLACESVSMLAAKMIEDCRIGGSPLEKSTRYIRFDQLVNGHYRYYREPTIMTSALSNLYTQTCDQLFLVYGRLVDPMLHWVKEKVPQKKEESENAYNAACRARALDALRGLLPASTLTNVGVFGNGRFFEGLIRKLHGHAMHECQSLGDDIYQELMKVIPSFIKRSSLTHPHCQASLAFQEGMEEGLRALVPEVKSIHSKHLSLLSATPNAPAIVAAAALFPYSHSPLESLERYCSRLPIDQIEKIIHACAKERKNRRHKGPRALERARFVFDIVADFGIYRDLQRHRILSQSRQLLTCDLGYSVPQDIIDAGFEKEYRTTMDMAKKSYTVLVENFAEEAQYIVPMGYNIRWMFDINLRSLQWFCELRSQPAGHSAYRFVAQEMARKVTDMFPIFQPFFEFVDYSGASLGRIEQEQRRVQKNITGKHPL